MEWYQTYQAILAGLVTAMLMGLALLVGICIAAVYLAPIVRWIRKHKGEAALVAPLVVGIVMYGGSKGIVRFPYTDVEKRYLFDAGSYVTNGYAHVAFSALILPQSATIYAYSRPYGSTNDAEWVERMMVSLAELATPSNIYTRDIYYEGAEDSEMMVFTDYTPSPVAHTNGVAVVFWQRPSINETNKAAMVRTGLWIDGRQFAPDPKLTNGVYIIHGLGVSAPNSNNEQEVNE